MAKVKGKQLRVHKHLFESVNGRVPRGMHLDHLCRNRDCIRPDHLEIVTPAENCHRGRVCKLSSVDVDEILKLKAHGLKQYKIAELFSVSKQQISKIVLGQRWKDRVSI